MSSSSSPKPATKRCRTDSSTRNRAGPSSEVLPLVMPNLVKKSSKDPNRGMYPKKRDSRKSKFGLSLPKFRKASKLYKKSISAEKTNGVPEDSDSSLSDYSVPDDMFQNKKSGSFSEQKLNKSKKTNFLSKSNKQFTTMKTRSQSNIASSILNYFQPSSHSKRKKTEKHMQSVIDINAPSTSGFQRRRKYSEPAKVNSETFFKKYDACYGLLGACETDTEERINYFEKLPAHVIEAILCQIPFLDLMKCKLVCSLWNEIISDAKFMEWKKIYYGLKYKQPYARIFMHNLHQRMDLTAVEDCFKVLIRYMADDFCRKPSSDMCYLLSKNLKAVIAEHVVTERFSDIIEGKESKPWCILAAAVLLSETVWDVYDLYKCLFQPKSECSLHDVTDALYCVASFLMDFRDVFNINHGLHYRVYYALYLIENDVCTVSKDVQSVKLVKGLPGQQSIHSYCDNTNSSLTYEQIRILNHCLQPKQTVKIIALAGTGKTTTLAHLARLYPQIKFLNIVFNKSVCEDAKKRFPSNVTCRTAHALAFRVFGRRLQHKLVSHIRPHDLLPFLKYSKGTSLHPQVYAKYVMDTISAYSASAEEEMSKIDVPKSDATDKIIQENEREKIKNDAIRVWKMMIDKDNACKITHDIYLKLYQLSKPKLAQYHCIMVDEAQDCNPAILDVILTQDLPVILVGDPNQQIYGFRGANNALESVAATHVYHLTKSFRFGPEIAYIASCCLESLKVDSRETLVGNSKDSYINGKTEGQLAIITRTNVTLLHEAVRLCCLRNFRDNEPTVIHGAFVGGIDGYRFDQILDIYRLRGRCRNHHDNEPLNDKFISKFKTFSDLYTYAKNVEDNDLLAKISFVNQHGSATPEYVKLIKEKCSHPIELANVVFTTAHKAKGLEFDTVVLTDDYQIGRLPVDVSESVWSEETSILYVAMTRAKRCLLLSERLMKILQLAQEKFEYPVSSRELLANVDQLSCVICAKRFVPHTCLTLVRRKFVTASGRVIDGGPLCMRCATEPTFRPQVHVASVIMYLDATNDYFHRSMACLVGPLPTDPPIVRTADPFNEVELLYIINVNF